MAIYKVTLEFYYESEEDVSDWGVDVDFAKVSSTSEARELAIAELEANSPHEFEFKVEEIG